jgi:arabinofuranosyltransferase
MSDSSSQPKSIGERRASSSLERLAGRLLWPILVGTTLVVIVNSWLGDDSYITFRTIDNLIHGYGLTWNTDERVQSFTHPLWLFLVTAFTLVFHSVYAAALLLSWSLVFLTLYLFAVRVSKSRIAAIGGLLLFASSKTFVHYSTSGLENVFTHAAIVLLWLAYGEESPSRASTNRLMWMGLLAGLMALNRLDTLLLALPPLAYACFRFARSGGGLWRSIGTASIGFIPLALWEAFSCFYYGFPFPNTAYAKLTTGIGALTYAREGIVYLIDSAVFDPLLLLVIPLGLIVALSWKTIRTRLPFAIGSILYLIYTVKIGGDFMAGRFLSAPFLISVMILSETNLVAPEAHRSRVIFCGIGIVALAVGCFNKNATISTLRNARDVRYRGARGVRADERSWWSRATGLSNLFGHTIPDDPTATAGRDARAQGRHFSVDGVVGYFGYEAGPLVHILDKFALNDPLLARLHANSHWLIGHYLRDMPDGYLETVKLGKNCIKQQSLATYYDKLTIATRGSLYSKDRWLTIWKLNTGAYDYLLADYEKYAAANPPSGQPWQ